MVTRRVPSRHVAVATLTIPGRPLGHAYLSVDDHVVTAICHWRRHRRHHVVPTVTLHCHADTVWPELVGMVRPRETWVIWAHDAGHVATATGMWRHLDAGTLSLRPPRAVQPEHDAPQRRRRWYAGGVVITDPPVIIRMSTVSGGVLVLVDIRNWVHDRLPAIARMCGIELPDPVQAAASPASAEQYVRLAVQAVYQAADSIAGLVAEHDLGPWRYTAAGQTLSAWRTHDGCSACRPTRCDARRAHERQAYYGGLVHPRYVGVAISTTDTALPPDIHVPSDMPRLVTGGIVSCDITSAYAAMMRDRPHPVGLAAVRHDPPVPAVIDWTAGYAVVASVDIDCREHPWPVRRHGRTIWATGRYCTTLISPELDEALQMGCVQRVHWAYAYRLGRPFHHWADMILDLRAHYDSRGDRVRCSVLKRMAAMLHGRIAARYGEWVVLPEEPARQAWGTYVVSDGHDRGCRIMQAIAGLVRERVGTVDPASSLPAAAASVAAWARTIVRQYCHVAGQHGVLYVDHDTLYCTASGYERLERAGCVCPGTPGMLRPTGRHEWMVVFGQRDYETPTRRVHLGHRRDATVDRSGRWQHTERPRLGSYLTAGMPTAALTRLRQGQEYHHVTGIAVGPDGWTHPILIDDTATMPCTQVAP